MFFSLVQKDPNFKAIFSKLQNFQLSRLATAISSFANS